MPRETRKPITRIKTPETESRPQRSAVVAQPVNMGMPSGNGGEMDALLKGLSQFNANLSNYVEEKARSDMEEGMRSAADGSPLNDDAPSWFKHGYLNVAGKVAGEKDGAAMRSAYDTEFDQDAGDIEQFLSKQWAERTKGLQDKSYLSGYAKSFAGSVAQLRKHHLQEQQRRVLETAEANATKYIHDSVKPFITDGREVPQETLDSLKRELSQQGVDRGRFNELLLSVAEREGLQGNHGIFALFRRPNADGTPGMYFIPKWKERIDAAEVRAQNIFLAKQEQAYTLAKRQREDKQDAALFDVFELLYTPGREAEAQTAFGAHVRSGLFSRASELVKWQEMFRKVESREMTASEQTQMTAGLYDIHTYRVNRPQEVLQLGLPPKETRQLLAELRTRITGDRSAAQTERAQADIPFQSHAFREQEGWLEAMLKPSHGILDRLTAKDEFMYSTRAAAKLELAEWVRANGLKDIRAKAIEIVERHKKKVADFEAARLDAAAGILRYATLDAAESAFQRKELSEADFALHLQYFSNRLKVTNQGGRK